MCMYVYIHIIGAYVHKYAHIQIGVAHVLGVLVCLREREREREYVCVYVLVCVFFLCDYVCVLVCVCVCVCVCVYI